MHVTGGLDQGCSWIVCLSIVAGIEALHCIRLEISLRMKNRNLSTGGCASVLISLADSTNGVTSLDSLLAKLLVYEHEFLTTFTSHTEITKSHPAE